MKACAAPSAPAGGLDGGNAPIAFLVMLSGSRSIVAITSHAAHPAGVDAANRIAQEIFRLNPAPYATESACPVVVVTPSRIPCVDLHVGTSSFKFLIRLSHADPLM
eukprot:IDg6915t1